MIFAVRHPIEVRPAELRDLASVSSMCHSLWPAASPDEHSGDMAPLLGGQAPGSLPAIVFLAEEPGGRAVGVLQTGLRSHADGCDPSHPVGHIEGWYVAPDCRGRGIGARLVAAAEDWARRQGCAEMASDTWLDRLDSQRAHEALGYQVVDRRVNYRKPL
ncbi:MAG TPA: GNAT family N-acetyltransferase [Bryobacteraceae bacterium]